MVSPIPIRFDVYRGDELLRTETFHELIIKIGRATSSHLYLDDSDASRLHAMVEVTSPEEVFIVDLGSRDGTYVNGERREKKTQLRDGDEIRIGETRMRVGLGPAPEVPGIVLDTTTEPRRSSTSSLPPALTSALVEAGATSRVSLAPSPPSEPAADTATSNLIRWAIAGLVLILLFVLLTFFVLRR